jgi:hypothetical protein
VILVRLRVLDRIADEGPVERKDTGAFGDEVSLKPVVGLGFMSDT